MLFHYFRHAQGTIVYIKAARISGQSLTIKPMSKSKIGRAYTSKTIVKILKKYITDDQKKIDRRTFFAQKIQTALEGKGLTHKDLAQRVGKRPSEIKRLLSAKLDFSPELLSRIQSELAIKLLDD